MGSDKNKPTRFNVFGLLNIIFGLMGVMGMIYALIQPFLPLANNPAGALYDYEPFLIYTVIASIIGLFLTIILIGSGIGLFMVKEWGRWGSVAYGVCALLMAVISAIAIAVMAEPALAGVDGPPAIQAAVKIGFFGGAIGGSCIGSIYPIVLLIFMFLPSTGKLMDSYNSPG